MAEEFQAGICSSGAGSWWNSSRTPCSTVVNDIGSFGWPNSDRCCDETTSVSDSSIVFPDVHKSQILDSGAGDGNVLINSTLQMMGFASSDWNHDLLRGRTDNNYMLQENMNSKLNSSEINEEFNSSIGSSSFVYPSTLLQNLFESDSQPQQSIFSDRVTNYSCIENYVPNNYPNEQFSPSWSKFSPFSNLKSSLPKPLPNSLNFSNNTPCYPSSPAGNNVRSNFSSSSPSQFMATTKVNNEEMRDSGSVMKKGSEPVFKRPRIETPSPLPTFKVRKEKLGDRITALQQLVSPFGKTDTASVLHEAIEYIKFLQDQVNVLSTPYMKNGPPIHQQVKDLDDSKQDLRSRGLCLVPISSTFPVANETTPDFWTPTFGGTYR